MSQPDVGRAATRARSALNALHGRIGSIVAPVPLVLLAALAGAVWLFVVLADEVVEQEAREVDSRIMLALRTAADPSVPLGPLWLQDAAVDVTALGSITVLFLLTLVAVGYLLLRGKPGMALVVVVSVLGAQALNSGLKIGFDRPRPDLVPHLTDVRTMSFPSGHAMLAAATYLTLGALLSRAERRRRLKLYYMALAVALTLLIGVSRVYLGVHWPSDVLAGWSAGAAWALLCWLVALVLQMRGQIQR